MDFQVNINGKVQVFEKYQEMMLFVNEYLAQWNNFDPNRNISITIKKIPGQSKVINIYVSDEIETQDLFGKS